jgi:hypothetical protein
VTVSSLPGLAVPFVGRERELAVLDRCAVAARHGDSCVVIIEGPAGAGKSSLLSRFVQRLPDVMVVRGSGAEPELSLPYGLIGQLVAAADMGSRDTPPPTADPLVVGADLAGLLTRQDATGRLVVLAIDDLHWADPGSAAALLFALRRMQGAAFLGVLSTRAAEIGLLGDGWSRFVNGTTGSRGRASAPSRSRRCSRWRARSGSASCHLAPRRAGTTGHGYLWIVFILALAVVASVIIKAGFEALPFNLPMGLTQLLLVLTGINLVLVLIAFLLKPSTGLSGLSVGWGFGAFVGLICAIAAVVPLALPLVRARSTAG